MLTEVTNIQNETEGNNTVTQNIKNEKWISPILCKLLWFNGLDIFFPL